MSLVAVLKYICVDEGKRQQQQQSGQGDGSSDDSPLIQMLDTGEKGIHRQCVYRDRWDVLVRNRAPKT